MRHGWVLGLACWMLAAPVRGATLDLFLDVHAVRAGTGIGGYLEIGSESGAPVVVEGVVTVDGGCLQYVRLTADGDSTVISRQTHPASFS